jgi:hypothetical protein
MGRSDLAILLPGLRLGDISLLKSISSNVYSLVQEQGGRMKAEG